MDSFDLLWIEPICDPNCNVTVDLFDLSLDMLYKINEFRKIKQDLEFIQQKDLEEKMQRENKR